MIDNQGQETSPNFDDAFTAPTTAEESSLDNTLSPIDAFTDASGETAPQEGQPEQAAPLENKNDDTRYEYWQSQASKNGNELQQAQQQLQQMQGYIEGMKQSAPAQQPQEEAEAEFPPAPDKPSKPAGSLH